MVFLDPNNSLSITRSKPHNHAPNNIIEEKATFFASLKRKAHDQRISATQNIVQSTPPPIPPLSRGTGEKPRYWKTAVKGVIYNQEKRIRNLKINGGIGGTRSTEGRYRGRPGDDCI